MRIVVVRLVALALGSMVLFACSGGGGGGGGASSPSATAPSVGEPASAAPSSDAGASIEASAPPSAAPSAGGGGGTAGGVCDLVTGDELAGILGVAVATQVVAGPPDTCDIQSADGAPLAAIVWMQQGGGLAFDAWASSTGITEIPGIGERAIYEPSSQLVLVKKGDQVVTVAVFDDGSGSPEARQELQTKIAQAAAGRF